MNLLSHLSCTILLILTVFHLGLGCKDEPVTDDIAGATVNVEVLPESINELITDEIKITCTPQDLPLDTLDILFIEMGKEGEHPLASLKGPTLKLGSDIKINMEAKGHISKNLSESYLQLSIKRPFVDDVGVYCCRMFYQNEFGELKMGHVYADVTVENNDKAVFLHLLDKVSKLEMYTHDLEKDLLKQQNYTHDLENTIEVQGKQLMAQDAKGSNRSLWIQQIVDRDSFSAAFNVYGTKSTIFNSGETLIFKHYNLNIGDHYDLATGVFTTPKRGLYVFHLSVWTNNRDDTWIYLKVNDEIMAGLYAYDNAHTDQSSVSTVLSLQAGDRVWPYVKYGVVLAQATEKQSVFNGYLLKLL